MKPPLLEARPLRWLRHPLALVGVLIVFVLAAGWAGMKAIWGRDLDAARTRVAAFGLPRNFTELYPPLPAGRDATDDVRALITRLDANEVEASKRHSVHERLFEAAADPATWDEETRGYLRRAELAELEEHVARIARADGARLVESDAIVPTDRWKVFPTLALVRCLSARAMVIADDGDGERAAALVGDLLAFERVFVEQTTLVRAAASTVLDRDIACALRYVVERRALDESSLRRLAAELEARDPHAERLRALDLEGLHSASRVFGAVRERGSELLPGGLGFVYGSVLGAPLLDEEEALYLDHVADMREQLVRSPWSPIVEREFPKWTRIVPLVAFRGERLTAELAQQRRTIDVARAAVALVRARQIDGRWPASLQELAPRFVATVPRDVPGGRELVLTMEGGLCRVALEARPLSARSWAWPLDWALER